MEVVRAIIPNIFGQILLIKRGGASYGGNKWELPGGKIDSDETPVIAVLREVLEETGLRVKITRDRVFQNDSIIEGGKHSGEFMIEKVYRTNIVAWGNVTLDNRHTEFGWFSKEGARTSLRVI